MGSSWIVGSPAVIIGTDSPYFTFDTFDHNVNTHQAFATASDEQGKLLFFCTGTKIYDKNGHLMENGDTTSDYEIYRYVSGYGLLTNQTALIFPRGNNQYWIIQTSVSDSQMLAVGVPIAEDQVFYHRIDMNANGGLGRVDSKKNLIYKGNLTDTHFTACKHANGRDYWLITNKMFDSICYIKFLVTPDSILGPYYQRIGTAYHEPDYLGATMFSPDGTRFAGISGRSKLNVFDFDRCSGEFSNALEFEIPIDSNWNGSQLIISGGGGQGLAFSPSGRYLYALCFANIRQYDLLLQNDQLIWRWDSTYDHTFTSQGYLAYNGKIVVSNWAGLGSKGYHTIDYPDSLGTACHFQWNSFKPKTLAYNTLNNTFNYRLGPLSGSGCDTLHTGIAGVVSAQRLRCYPNPAKEKVVIDLMQYLPDASLQVVTMNGELKYDKKNFYLQDDIDVSSWPEGAYVVRVGNSEKKYAVPVVICR